MSPTDAESRLRGDPALAALYPFRSRYHSIGGHRLHYVDEGSGDPIVMVHGNPTWSFYYRRLAAALRKSHRIVVPDHIGCGLSDKPRIYRYTLETHIDNLESLIEARKLRGITLVLHDWGGAIGMGYAARHPANVTRLVVLNSAAFISDRVPLRIRICRLPVLGPLAVRGVNGFVRASFRMAVHDRSRMTPDVRRGYLLPYDSWASRIAILRFVQDIPRAPADPSFAVLEEIDAALPQFRDRPVLIQWGARDFCFDDGFLAGWRARFPDAEVDIHEEAAHYVLEDAHERIIPRVRSFLERS